jgi:multidrug transporter EmrE-like cation transporter
MTKLIGIILIVAGTAGLAYGGFTYTKERHDVKLGPIQLSVKEKQRVSVPVWAGVASIAAGVVLLLLGGKK